MKTITTKDGNVSKYIFDDDVSIIMTESNIITSLYIIGDLNINTANKYSGVTPPEDWVGNKYTYTPVDGWVLIPEPVPPEA